MIFFRLIGLDADKTPYVCTNETQPWTLRGFRQGTTEAWLYELRSEDAELQHYYTDGKWGDFRPTDAPPPPLDPMGYWNGPVWTSITE